MIFDVVYDLQDVGLKCADVFILASQIETQREYFIPYVMSLGIAVIVATALSIWRFR